VYAYDAEVSSLTHTSIQEFVNDLAQRTKRPVGAYVAHHQYKSYDAGTLSLAYMWIPRYGSNDGTDQVEPDFPCDVHQFTSQGRVPGIEGNVNLSHVTGTGKTLDWFRGETP
jgi:GH25 family lysozyme M1 (1,4-beta-N-acetylmuramidase)